MPTETILDCHHNDVSDIVEARILARLNRSWFNRRRYERKHGRRR